MMQVALFAQLALASTAFSEGGQLPAQYGCMANGAEPSPPLELQHRPMDATHWALVVDEPDSGTILWAVWNIPIRERFLNEGVPKDTTTLRIRQGRNGKKHIGWSGPCPAPGQTRKVRFRAYALKAPLGLSLTSTGGDVLQAVKGFITIEDATLNAFYTR